jgi:hypothetical protein
MKRRECCAKSGGTQLSSIVVCMGFLSVWSDLSLIVAAETERRKNHFFRAEHAEIYRESVTFNDVFVYGG